MIYNTNPAVTDSPLVIWDNLLFSGDLTASNSATGFPVSGLLNGVTTDPWKPASLPVTLEYDAGSTVTASCLCFAAHNMGSKGVTVIFERLVSATWTLVIQALVPDDMPFILSFPPQEAQEWRVRFTGSNVFQVSVVTLAYGLIMPGRVVPPHVPLHRIGEVDLVGGSESGTGEFLQADFLRTGGNANINFSVQLPAFAAGDDFEGFRTHFNCGKPFFFASFPTYEPKDVGYLWRGERARSILTPYQDAKFMTVSMEVDAYVK